MAGMDPLLNLLKQRPRENWEWNFDPGATGESAINAVALCNASLLTYSAQPDVRRFLAQWGFDDAKILRGFSTQGFVARHGEALVVAFRGTEPIKADDWLSDVNYHQRELSMEVPGLVHGGFANALGEIADDMLAAVTELDRSASRRIFVTGHSLGGALAVLAAALIRFGAGREVAGVFTYGQPRVGDPAFSAGFDDALGEATFRYVNDLDIVPHVPPTRLPARPVLRAPAPVRDFFRNIAEVPREIRTAFDTFVEGQQFHHVGQLRLFLDDRSISSDELEWQKREVLYSGTFTDLLKNFPNLLRAQLAQLLRAHDRILHHDPVRGYLPKLEARLQ